MKSRIQKEFNDHVATAKFTLDSITENLEKAALMCIYSYLQNVLIYKF